MGNAPSEYTDHTWHALTAQDALKVQRSSASGLSQDEAQRRLQQHGANRLPPPQRRGPLLRLLYQFHNVLLYLMLVAAIITALLGHWVDTSVILAAVLINVIIGFKDYLGVYDQIVALTDGGPGTATRSVAFTILRGFQGGDYAYQMANAAVFFIITILIALLQLRVTQGRSTGE